MPHISQVQCQFTLCKLQLFYHKHYIETFLCIYTFQSRRRPTSAKSTASSRRAKSPRATDVIYKVAVTTGDKKGASTDARVRKTGLVLLIYSCNLIIRLWLMEFYFKFHVLLFNWCSQSLKFELWYWMCVFFHIADIYQAQWQQRKITKTATFQEGRISKK